MEPLDPSNLTDREILLLVYNQQTDMAKRVDSHGKRLSSLEAWRNVIVGGAAVVGIGYKLIISYVEAKVKG